MHRRPVDRAPSPRRPITSDKIATLSESEATQLDPVEVLAGMDGPLPAPPRAHHRAASRRSPTPAIPRGAVVVALGPADDAGLVLNIGSSWARLFGAPLVINQIVPEHPTGEDKGLCEQVYAWVDDNVGEHEPVYFEVRHEDATQQLLSHAENSAARLIVVGEAGHREGWLARIFRPSFRASIVRTSRCPVLIAKRSHHIDRVIVATELDENTASFLRAATDEVRRVRAHAVVLHGIAAVPGWSAVDPTVAAGFADTQAGVADTAARVLRNHADAAGLAGTECRIELDAPSVAINDVAVELGADLIICGSHGRTGAARVLMGSTCEAVIRESPCNVLVIPYAALQDDLETRPHRPVSVARGTGQSQIPEPGIDYDLPQTD